MPRHIRTRKETGTAIQIPKAPQPTTNPRNQLSGTWMSIVPTIFNPQAGVGRAGPTQHPDQRDVDTDDRHAQAKHPHPENRIAPELGRRVDVEDRDDRLGAEHDRPAR